jgi:hypothetical protein
MFSEPPTFAGLAAGRRIVELDIKHSGAVVGGQLQLVFAAANRATRDRPISEGCVNSSLS